MKKYLKTDDTIKTLETKKDLWEYLDFRKEHDEWVKVFINEMAAVGIKNEPLFFPQYCHNLSVKKNGYTLDLPDIDYELEENIECIEDTGLFLVLPYKNKIQPLPIRSIAFASICKRADDDGMVMYRFDTKPNKGVLPIDEKAERLTRDYQLFSDDCKVLYRDGKISAALSKDYVILPAHELIKALENQLSVDHPNFSFHNGMVSHEYLIAEYLMNDPIMEESFRMALNDAGADFSNIQAGIQFSTSDIGASKAYASVFYIADGVRTILSGGIAMEHKGDSSIDKFRDALCDLGTLFKESEERIEALGNTDIRDIAGCIQEICSAYTFIPKKCADAVIEEQRTLHPSGGTAIDVYLALNDIVNRHAKQNLLTPTNFLNLSEQVGKLINLPFDKIDAKEEWKKI